MSIFSKIRPLQAGEKIVDTNGGVAPTFALLWQQLFTNAGWLNENKVPNSRQIIAGDGLTGGGDLSEDRTLALETLSPDPSGSYTSANITVDEHGRVIEASSGSGGGSWIPLVDGAEPPSFITDGAGALILVAYA